MPGRVGGSSEPPVQAGGRLQLHVGPRELSVQTKGQIRSRPRPASTPVEPDTPASRRSGAAAAGLRVGIGHGDHPGDARLEDRVGAGRRAAVMVAGLQGAIEGGAPRTPRRFGRGPALGVGRAGAEMHAAADHLTLGDHHGPTGGLGQGRVGMRAARSSASAMKPRSAPETLAGSWQPGIKKPFEHGGAKGKAGIERPFSRARPGRTGAWSPTSPIRTVTVGSGISPDHAPRPGTGCGLAGFDRRWGLPPRPEAGSRRSRDLRVETKVARRRRPVKTTVAWPRIRIVTGDSPGPGRPASKTRAPVGTRDAKRLRFGP